MSKLQCKSRRESLFRIWGGWGYGGVRLGRNLEVSLYSFNRVCRHHRGRLKQMAAITKVHRLHGAYMNAAKKKDQPVRIGLVSLGTRMVAGFPEMVPGAGLEPARLAAGDFESPESTNFTTRADL